jgi:hypothetical protein
VRQPACFDARKYDRDIAELHADSWVFTLTRRGLEPGLMYETT